MYKIISKRVLAPNVNEYTIQAPMVARNARPGQFIILRVDEEGERVPFTICDMDKEKGTITILVQTVGSTTYKLSLLGAGDAIADFVGPLGNATDLSEYNDIILVAGGIGSAVVYPQAKYLASIGKKATVILGARNEGLLMYVDEYKKCGVDLCIMTDDGSCGEKGFVTQKLQAILQEKKCDVVMAVGPLMMMKAVCDVTRPFEVPTVVSLNSVMVDGSCMCGCCRVTVGGETKYACVDGPEFDGHKVDFAEAAARSAFYKEKEQAHYCNLRGKIEGGKQ